MSAIEMLRQQPDAPVHTPPSLGQQLGQIFSAEFLLLYAQVGRFWPCQCGWQTAWSAPIEKSFHNAANGPNGYALGAVFEVKKEIPVKGDPPMKSVKLAVLALVAISSLLVLLDRKS